MKKIAILFIFLLFAPLQNSLLADATTVPVVTSSTAKVPEHVIITPTELTEVPAKPHESYEHAFIKMILTLVGLLALVFFTLWALRKLTHGRVGNFGTQKKIKILEKRPLSPKTVLYLLELDGKEIFVSESQLEVRSLLNLSETEL